MASHSRVFEAKYGGHCGICDDRFDEGDDVCFCGDEVCHTDCAEDE